MNADRHRLVPLRAALSLCQFVLGEKFLPLSLAVTAALLSSFSVAYAEQLEVRDEPTARKLFIEVEQIARLSQEEQLSKLEHLYRDLFPPLCRRLYALYAEPVPITEYHKLPLDDAATKVAGCGGWPALQEAALKTCRDLLVSHNGQLVRLVKEDFNGGEEKRVATALLAIAEFRLAEFFGDVLEVFQRNETLSQRAAYVLRDLGDPRAIRALVEKDPKQPVQYFELLRSLSRSRPADSALVKLLGTDNAQVRWRAAYALAESGDDALLPYVQRLIRDENPQVRKAAVNIAFFLSKEPFAKLRPSLVALLNDGDAMVRFDVGIFFASHHDNVCARTLVRLLQEGALEGGYNSTAVQSLHTLTGSYFGYELNQPPSAAANQAALARFEDWIKAQVHEEPKP